MRRIISKFAVPISLILWYVIYLITDEDSATFPNKPENELSEDDSIIISPRGSSDDRLPLWAVFAALIPAVIVMLLVSVQHLVSIHFINKKLKASDLKYVHSECYCIILFITERTWLSFRLIGCYCHGWTVCFIWASMDISHLGAIISKC